MAVNKTNPVNSNSTSILSGNITNINISIMIPAILILGLFCSLKDNAGTRIKFCHVGESWSSSQREVPAQQVPQEVRTGTSSCYQAELEVSINKAKK